MIEYEYAVEGKKPNSDCFINVTIKATDSANAWHKFKEKYPEYKVNTKMVRKYSIVPLATYPKSEQDIAESIARSKIKEQVSREDLIESFRYKKSKRDKRKSEKFQYGSNWSTSSCYEIYDMPPKLGRYIKHEKYEQLEFEFINPFLGSNNFNSKVYEMLDNCEIKDLFSENPKNIFD